MSESDTQKSSNELAKMRTDLAELRSDLARNRTLQAAERTYAAWVRTGFTIAGAGWTLGQALQNTESREVALLIGGDSNHLRSVVLCLCVVWFQKCFRLFKAQYGSSRCGGIPFYNEYYNSDDYFGGLIYCLCDWFWPVAFLKNKKR